MWKVYQLRLANEEKPFYIGCTSRTVHRRWIEHKHRAIKRLENSGRGAVIRDALAKGLEVLVEELEKHPSQVEAHIREDYWISFYGRIPNGSLVNTDPGGTGVGRIISNEARAKMAESKLGNKTNVGRLRPDFREITRKDITAFLASGKRIGSYETSRLAGEATGVHWKAVSESARGRVKATKSKEGTVYQFKFGIIENDIDSVNYRGKTFRKEK